MKTTDPRNWLHRYLYGRTQKYQQPAVATARDESMAQVDLKGNEQVSVVFKATGVSGGDTSAQFTGNVSWSANDQSIIQLVPDATQLAAKAIAQGVAGSVTVSATGVDAAGRTFTAQGTITVTAVVAPPEETSAAELVFGTPEPAGS